MKIYTETVLHGPDAFQIAIVEREDGTRITGRVEGPRVAIDDEVEQLEIRGGVTFFRKK